uniref:Uncharacterized protein n=1 Tax=Physcomitrium patens TaxID=3218 RepID=A0A7I4CWN9_PHYPA
SRCDSRRSPGGGTRSDYDLFLDASVACGSVFTGAEGIKTEEEAEVLVGTAGVAYDINYHGAGDTLDTTTAFVVVRRRVCRSRRGMILGARRQESCTADWGKD